jgi:predicted transcriptional regulator
VIYASTPRKKIVGIGRIARIISSTPSSAWEMAKHAAGISRKEFRKYFSGKAAAYSIEIRAVIPFARAVDPKEIDPAFRVPQSFLYVTKKFLDELYAVGGKALEK